VQAQKVEAGEGSSGFMHLTTSGLMEPLSLMVETLSQQAIPLSLEVADLEEPSQSLLE
jgi:hypothetical protein